MNHDPDDERDAEIWNDAKEKFYELYWGEIPFVADDEVMTVVEEFSTILHGAVHAQKKKPSPIM